MRSPKGDDPVLDRQAVIDLFLLLEDGFDSLKLFLSQNLEVLRFILWGFLQFGDDLFELSDIAPEKLKEFSLNFASSFLSMLSQMLVSEEDLSCGAGIGPEVEIDAKCFCLANDIKACSATSVQEFNVGGIVDGRRDDGRVEDGRSSFDEFLLFENRKDLIFDKDDALFANTRTDLGKNRGMKSLVSFRDGDIAKVLDVDVAFQFSQAIPVGIAVEMFDQMEADEEAYGE